AAAAELAVRAHCAGGDRLGAYDPGDLLERAINVSLQYVNSVTKIHIRARDRIHIRAGIWYFDLEDDREDRPIANAPGGASRGQIAPRGPPSCRAVKIIGADSAGEARLRPHFAAQTNGARTIPVPLGSAQASCCKTARSRCRTSKLYSAITSRSRSTVSTGCT